MHQHPWVPAEGTIVDFQSKRHEHTYTIDAMNVRGVHVRATVRHKSPTAYPVGSKLRIEIDEHNQMRFDQNAPGGDPLISTMTMSDQIAEAASAFDDPWTRGPEFGRRASVQIVGGETTIRLGDGGLPEGLAAFVGALGVSNARVIGPDGGQIPVDADEIAQLTQAVVSGDATARQAAIQRLHQLRDAANTSSPLANTADVSGGATVEQRLASLDHLLSKGMLNQSEYETQRQRIIESI